MLLHTWRGHLPIQGDKYSMIRKRLKPVAIDGITFDAMLSEQKDLNATIPKYPVESGFPISDTIVLEPIGIQMTLYISNTPVTFLYRHSNSMDRVKKICEQIEKLWLSKKLVKIVTPDTIYTDMGLTSISIKKSKELGYAREISITATKVRITNTKTASIPDYVLKSGQSITIVQVLLHQVEAEMQIQVKRMSQRKDIQYCMVLQVDYSKRKSKEFI